MPGKCWLVFSREKRHCLVAAIVFFTSIATAQTYPLHDHDTSYYSSYKGTVIGRIFFSRRYMHINLDPPGNLPKMGFHANTPLNLGLGFTYRSFFFSYSRGLGFLESDRTRGKSKSTDIQVHLYKRKWVIDALGEFYKGFYLTPHGLGSVNGHSFYIRPDIGIQFVGSSVYRILNDKRFSYGAGFSQNAWQQKSAGSFLIGGEVFYTAVNADSALVPQKIDSGYNSRNIRKIHLFEIGPGLGYGYTLVIQKHYFLLASLNANLNLSYGREIGNNIASDKIAISPNYIFRMGCGYNTSNWGASLVWISSSVKAQGKATGYDYSFATGSYRLVYARRFALNGDMRRIIRHGAN